MGVIFGYQDCRETPAWVLGGRGGKEGEKYIHRLDKLCSVSAYAILKVRVREKSKFC